MTLKKFFGLVSAVSSVALAVVGYLRHDYASHRFERAQKQTVLVSTVSGSGTGVVVKRHDHVFVWTAAHVVSDTGSPAIKVILRNGLHKAGDASFTGSVIAKSIILDVALISVDAPENFFEQSATFDDILPLPVGSSVYHVGNFLGTDFDNSVSTGVLSQVGVNPEHLTGWPWPVADQTTALIVPGSSGGPIFNDKNNRVLGLAVGTVDNIFVFVPIRAIEVFANSAHVFWAVRGHDCPSNAELRSLAEPFKVVATPPVLILKLNKPKK